MERNPSATSHVSKTTEEFETLIKVSRLQVDDLLRCHNVQVQEIFSAISERDRYHEALEKIASCEPRHPGDVVSIAREAIGK